jgi:hypothetical protein
VSLAFALLMRADVASASGGEDGSMLAGGAPQTYLSVVYPIRGGPRMKAVAIYARVSTAQQEKQGTIESQLAVLEEYAAEHENW